MKGSDFEAVDVSGLQIGPDSGQARATTDFTPSDWLYLPNVDVKRAALSRQRPRTKQSSIRAKTEGRFAHDLEARVSLDRRAQVGIDPQPAQMEGVLDKDHAHARRAASHSSGWPPASARRSSASTMGMLPRYMLKMPDVTTLV